MASIAIQAGEGAAAPVQEVSRLRLYALRAMYLVLVVGLGATVVPDIVSHRVGERGVIASLLGAVWLLAFLGLRYPLQMLPLLLFEFGWKALWMIAYGLPQWAAGQRPPTFSDDFFNIALGVILVPLVLPWPYVWRHYVRAKAESWRREPAKEA
jgi:hypothetical protein